MAEVVNGIDVSPTEEAYGELLRAYNWFNESLFGDQRLPGVMFTLVRRDSTCGYYSKARFATADRRRGAPGRVVDEIAMNPQLFGTMPIEEILATVGHEMCHQWQACYGKPSRGRYHNAEWARKMEQIGLIPSSTGRPGGARTGQHMSDYVEPGGRFAVACARLMATGFRVTWYDRIVPELPKAWEPAESAVLSALNSIRVSASLAFEEHADLGEDQDGFVLAVESAAESEVPLPERDFVVRMASSGSGGTRVKYACNTRQHAVWGRAGLRLACLECGGEFEAVGDGTEPVAREFARTRRKRSAT